MPTVPYAKVLASVNSAANASGGLVVPGSATIALTGENTSQWSSQRWEIYSYPPDFSAPAGWSTDGNGVIFSTAVAPPSFALPALGTAAGWGKYMLRLTVNSGLTNGKADATLIDESTALRMTSTRGLRAIGFNETTQFGGAREQYAAELLATLRAIEAFSGGSSLPVNHAAVEKTANYTLVPATDHTVVFTGSGTLTAQLPAAPSVGDEFVIVNATSNALFVDTNGNSCLPSPTNATSLIPGQSNTYTKTTTAHWVVTSFMPTVAAQAVSALAIDWSLGSVFTKTLAAGANTFTFSNQASGMIIVVRVTGAASTLVWPTVKWAGGTPPTQTASGTDVYTFVHDGTNIYGSVVQAMA